MKVVQQALTFDDVLLIPGHSTVLPKDVQLKSCITKDIELNMPIISAAMDTVTEAKFAITIAQEGGLGIIHKNMTVREQAKQVKQVKKYESGVVRKPITAPQDISVKELLKLTEKFHFSGVPVVGEDFALLGIVTGRDVRFADNLDQPISEIMTPKERLITADENASKETIIGLLQKHRIEKVLLVNDAFQLRGLVTVKDIKQAKEKPLASKDDQGRLRVGAAVGTGGDTEERVHALVEAGVDLIVVDTAHGHSQGVIDRVKWVKDTYPHISVVGGNIATADAALALVKAGADGVKVGIGPGSICTTRIVAGVGVPQITAISNVADALKGKDIPVIADGGIRYSGDMVKAMAAGASVVMMGGLFAGTEESPGDVVLFQGRSYKSYRGMGSIGAMEKGSSDRYFQDESDAEKLVPEGIEGRVPYKGSVLAVFHQLMGGLRSGMGYTGCATIDDLHTKAEFVQVTGAGMKESHVHDVTITKEPPNYQYRS